jgi:thioredoxin
MKKLNLLLVMFIVALTNACSNGQNSGNVNLSAVDFQKKLAETPNGILLDVRTPGEYEKGHIANSRNIDWNGDNFEAQAKSLNHDSPLFVYCLSGGRSANAAAKLRTMGFSKVYELAGGIMKWRAAGLPDEVSSGVAVAPAAAGMSKMDMDKLIASNNLIVFDFFATWCGPCKKLKPELDAIEKEMGSKIKIVRVDTDQNKAITAELQITEIPTIMIYKNKQIVWTGTGYFPKGEIEEHLK